MMNKVILIKFPITGISSSTGDYWYDLTTAQLADAIVD